MNRKTVGSMVSGAKRSGANPNQIKDWLVYIVECANGFYYTGVTDNVKRRIREHNAKKGARYTRSFGPVRLVWAETQSGHSAALKREAQIKRWTRANKESLIKGNQKLLNIKNMRSIPMSSITSYFINVKERSC